MQLLFTSPRRPAFSPGRDLDRGLEPARRSRQRFSPAVDIFEEATRFVVQADLPGVDAATIDVTVERDLLTIRGERKIDATADGATLQRAERASGSFSRSFRLPETAASDGVEAACRDGVLTVSIPKAKEATPYRIEVTAH